MTQITIDDELDLIKRRKTPAQLDAEAGRPAMVPPAPQPPAPAPKMPAEIDAELGLPPAATGLPPAPATDAGTWDILGAAWRAETVRTDAWNDTLMRRQALAEDMFRLLPPEVQKRLTEKSWTENGGWAGLEYEVTTAAADLAKNPEAAAQWAGYPLSLEAFDRQIDAGRRADLDEAQAILDQPGGAVAEFIGAAARAMTDETSLMLLPFGISGSAWRTIAGEAALGAAGEAAVLPKEFRVARELDLPEPDPVSRIALGAVAGGAFSAAIIGLGKGARALMTRAEARKASIGETLPAGTTRVEHEAAVDAAEAELRGDQTVQERLRPGGMGGGEAAPPGTLGDVLAEPAPGALPPVGPDAPPDWERIRNGIFAGESGADWNALYGYQNRKGGVFSRVKPTQMTVDQWLEFQDPSGEYAQWVKGQIGRVATPMGAYQIVGTTLRAAKKGLGLKGDEVMTPEMQDYIAQWIYRQQGTGAWVGYKGPRDSYTPGMVDGPAPAVGPTSRGYTGSGQVKIGDEFTIDVDWQVVDASTLIRASGDLQPRDRSRIASDAWIADTAARLDPAQLMPAPTADRGTPIVGPDNIIESGNGRFGAIERAYARHPDRAAAYRSAIEQAGFAIPEGVERPVLIARRKTEFTPEERIRATVAAQDSGVAVMTPTEIARVQSRALSIQTLSLLDPTLPLRDPANGAFVRAMLGALPKSAQGALATKEGALNALGAKQLREALFARAWPDPQIIARYTEGDPGDLKSLLEALELAAPGWAALRADIEAGLVAPDMDISPFVLDAMRLIGAAREVAAAEQARRAAVPKGQRSAYSVADALRELLEEVDLVTGPVSPLTAALVRKMWQGERAAKAEDVAAFLTRYAADARKAGASGALFDAPTPRDVLQAIDPETFADLPEDIGAARPAPADRPATEAPPEAVTDLPGTAFDQGARSPEAEATHAEIEADLRGQAAEAMPDLAELIRGRPTFDEVAAHPAVLSAVEAMDARVPTTELPGFGEEAFWSNRRYSASGQELVGRAAAVDHLFRQADDLAWREDGLTAPQGAVRSDRQATILLGAPAAGKSTVANPLARARGAMIVDADEAKKLIPEYEGGIGASAVHEESSILSADVLARAVGEGKNMVLPKVGATPGSIEQLASRLAANGYRVDLVLIDVPGDEAIRRMIGRFIATGRIIPLDVLQKGVDGAKTTYQLLKSKEFIHAYSHIDNSPGLGQPRRAVEDPAQILEEIARGNRGDGNARPGRGVQGGGSEDLTEAAPAADTPETALPMEAAADPIAATRADLGAFAEVEIDLPDGTTARAGDLLDDLEADRQFDAFLQACATTPTGAVQ